MPSPRPPAAAMLLLGAAFAGCSALPSRAVDPKSFLPPYRVEIQDGTNGVVEDRLVVADSPEELALRRWLEAHAGGWRFDPHTYAPSRRILGDKFDLNVSGPRAVLNVGGSQFVRTIDPADVPPIGPVAP